MSLENIVYDFAVWVEANSSGAMSGSEIHADTYEEMNAEGGTRFTRIDNLMFSDPLPAGNGEMQELNAVLEVQFLQVPVDQTLTGRRDARTTVNAMAIEFIKTMYENRDLRSENHEVCNVRAQKRGDWVKVGNIKTPRAVVSLLINPDANIRS